ncbi:MAG: tetratricopeptide repeat protein, partial [Bryobacteraceae bacterium]|nr:tetratricopeptide repeat protein [Bryobacteraceae bacterium]
EAAALELAGQFETALARVDAALAQYPGNADLPSLAGRLRQKLEEQGRSRMLASRVGRIEAAIHAGNWDLAEAEWQDARRVLPAEEALAQFPGAIQEGKHRAHMRSLQGRVEDSLNRQDVDDAERQLSAASEAFPEESVWQTLRSDCLRLRQYLESLASAENARGRKEYELAGRILTPLLAGAPDRCAARLLDEVNAARRAAEEEASRVEEERRRRADEGARRKRERAAIAKGRAQAAALVRKADYPAAIALLDRLAGEYPDAMEIRRDLDAAKLELQTRQREAEEQARLLREQALAARREEAAKLLRDGDPPGALALLDRMNLEFPDVIEIRQDRETIAGELDRQRREAEERTRRLREQAIAAGRQEADTLLSAGDALGAMALLDRLAKEYPEVSAIRRDREAAARTEERLRREAEDQARREREREVVAAGRAQAAALLREGNHQSAIALLIQLAAEYPENLGLQSDREAARRDWERQQREAEEETRRRREHSIATGRQEAAESLRNGDAPGAIAILDRLIADYPEAIEIRHDREAAVAEGERQRREAEERALRERERQAIQAGRAQAAALAGAGSHQAAIALLDQLAAQYPGDPQIREDRQVAWLAWEKLRSEAEEQARRERELAAILQGRGDAARFVQDGDYQAASALLDRLALQFPGNPDIEQDRKSAVEALERQHSEAEARARRALATFSASRREPGESAEPAVRTRKPLGRPVRKPHPGAGRPADDTSAPFSSGLRTGLGRADGGEPGAASDGRSTASEMTGLQNPGAPSRTHSGAESAPVPGTALSRLCHYAGHAILAVRNAIAVFLGKGDRSVIVPVLDPTAAAALGWIVQRHPGDLALLTARDELMRRPGRASASRDRLILLVAGIAVVVVLTSYLACRPAAARARASQAGVKPAPPAAAIVPGR